MSNYAFSAKSDNKARVIKIQHPNEYLRLRKLIREAHKEELLSPEHLKLTKTTRIGDHSVANLVKKMPGITLAELIDNNNATGCLNVGQLLEITAWCLHQLHEQVTGRGLVHKDVKPENIMVSVDPLRVNFIDFGFAKSNRSRDKDVSGTLLFASREAFDKKSHYKSDVYSLAIALGCLWNQPAESHFIPNKHTEMVNPVFNDLFQLENKVLREGIRNLLIAMSALNPQKRYSIWQAQKAFLKIVIPQEYAFDLPPFAVLTRTRKDERLFRHCNALQTYLLQKKNPQHPELESIADFKPWILANRENHKALQTLYVELKNLKTQFLEKKSKIDKNIYIQQLSNMIEATHSKDELLQDFLDAKRSALFRDPNPDYHALEESLQILNSRAEQAIRLEIDRLITQSSFLHPEWDRAYKLRRILHETPIAQRPMLFELPLQANPMVLALASPTVQNRPALAADTSIDISAANQSLLELLHNLSI